MVRASANLTDVRDGSVRGGDLTRMSVPAFLGRNGPASRAAMAWSLPATSAASRGAVVFVAGVLAAALSLVAPIPASAATAASWGNPGVVRTGLVLASISTAKSRYDPGDTVVVTVDATNHTGSSITGGTVTLYAMHLQTPAARPISRPLSVSNGASLVLTFSWAAPPADFTGYMLTAVATNASGTPLDSINDAVDVSSSWARFPRYGYMTHNSFGNPAVTPSQAASIMSDMVRYHIDGLQYYDWQYDHDEPLCGTVSSPCASWTDDGNQERVYASAVEDLVKAGHADNIVAMAYNSIYSADNGTCCQAPSYLGQRLGISPTWGIYTGTDHTTPAAFFQWDYMDPSNPDWQRFIMDQEMKAIKAFSFDGFHADSFGDLDTVDYTYNGKPAGVKYDPCTTDTVNANSTTPVHNVAGSPTWVNGTFPSFLQYAKSVLANKYLIFNPVTYDHAHCEANTSPVSVLYSELWPNNQDQYWSYNDIKQAIDEGSEESAAVSPDRQGKSLVVAAYQDYSPSGGGTFDTPDVLLLDATIFASGGSHIELGDNGLMLDNQNFTVGATPVRASLAQSVHDYYNFLTAYEDLLRDGQHNTSQTVSIQGQTVSSRAAPNSIWAFTKAGSSHEVIQLINFDGEKSVAWQTGPCSNCTEITSPHPVPRQLSNARVKYYYVHQPKAVFFASPDYNDGTTYQLPFTLGRDTKGAYVSFTLPSLSYWDMVYMSRTGPGNAPMLPGTTRLR